MFSITLRQFGIASRPYETYHHNTGVACEATNNKIVKYSACFFNIVGGFAHHQLPIRPQIIHSYAKWTWKTQIHLYTCEQPILLILAAIYGKTSCKVGHLAVQYAWKSFAKCMKKLGYLIQNAWLNAAFCWIKKQKRATGTHLWLRISDKFEVEVDGIVR